MCLVLNFNGNRPPYHNIEQSVSASRPLLGLWSTGDYVLPELRYRLTENVVFTLSLIHI